MNINKSVAFVLFASFLLAISCSKHKHHSDDDNAPINPVGISRTVVYTVKGTNFNIDYIDSNSVYKTDQVFMDSFVYTFKKGSGANVGLTVHPQSGLTDIIYSWSITIDGVLYANAFSEGGAFLSVPYK